MCSHEFKIALTLHGCDGGIGEQRDEEEVDEVDEGEPVEPEEACYRETGQTHTHKIRHMVRKSLTKPVNAIHTK